ncbi:hypothetical protein AAKU67_003505 [Oxalobacteraceae bacterium GrIS 2.11]
MRADLESMQARFAQGLIDLNLVDAALADFKGDPALNRERFSYYRGNISAIWQQTCASAYPVLQKLLGTDFFNGLTRAYGEAYPSQSGNLNEFGASMSSFISILDSCRPYPYLSDVAALEWLVHRAYYLKQQDAVSLAQLAAVAPENLGDVLCQLQPCCALIESPWAIADIWHAHQGDTPVFPEQIEAQSYALVWRQPWQSSWKVQVSSLSVGSYMGLQALHSGEALGTALEKALSVDSEFAVQDELADWLKKQLIISIN